MGAVPSEPLASEERPLRVRKVRALKISDPGIPMAPAPTLDVKASSTWHSMPSFFCQADDDDGASTASIDVASSGEEDGTLQGGAQEELEEEETPDSYRYCNVVRCPAGHAMHGKVVREVVGRFRCGLLNPQRTHCAICERTIPHDEMKYRCRRCNVSYCTECSRERLGLPTATSGDQECVAVLPGDILFCGPDVFGIHHVVLVVSELVPEPELSELLDLPPGMEVWGCDTVESVQDARGEAFEWYPVRTYIGRDPYATAAFLVGDMPQRKGDVEAIEPMPLKMLLSPLRTSFGGPGIDSDVFAHAVRQGEEASQAYSYATRVRMGVDYLLQQASLQNASLDAAHYRGPQLRAELLRVLERSWTMPPICSSVPVQTWQRYLLLMHDDPDAAVEDILKYMPVLSSNVLPATLVKELTKKGWVLKDNLEP